MAQPRARAEPAESPAHRREQPGGPAARPDPPRQEGPGSHAGTAEPYGTREGPDRCLITHRLLHSYSFSNVVRAVT